MYLMWWTVDFQLPKRVSPYLPTEHISHAYKVHIFCGEGIIASHAIERESFVIFTCGTLNFHLFQTYKRSRLWNWEGVRMLRMLLYYSFTPCSEWWSFSYYVKFLSVLVMRRRPWPRKGRRLVRVLPSVGKKTVRYVIILKSWTR